MYLRNLNVLIIEDQDLKYARIENLVGDLLRERRSLPTFERAENYERAIEKLAGTAFDVVLLDILLPIAGGDPTSAAARSILQRIDSGAIAGAPITFGITAQATLPENDRAFFESNVFNVLHFDENSTDWAQSLAARIDYILAGRCAAAGRWSTGFATELLVVTTRFEAEFAPICEAIPWFGPTFEGHPLLPDIAMKRGTIEINPTDRIVGNVLCIGEKGLAPAAALTALAVSALRPRKVVMLGVCCGLDANWPDCSLGDMVIARESDNWDAGRYETLDRESIWISEARPISARFGGTRELHQLAEQQSSNIERAMREVWRQENGARLTPKAYRGAKGRQPKVRIGQCVSGLSVVDSVDMREEVARRFGKALALDMEIHGFYQACAMNAFRQTQYAAIKGVADFGDGKKVSGAFDRIQPIIAKMSWAALYTLLGGETADGQD
ncbi:MAG: hypothetical protein JNL81_13155 [Hyphomonadaceae bacterium]|nr:hypothetical protein [Hyphomonadaceae bacterium]